jgi:hypothetical protein
MVSTKYFELLPYKFDIEKLQSEVTSILSKVPLSDDNQISLVHRNAEEKNYWMDGIGSPFLFDENRIPIKDNRGELIRRYKEEDFKYLNEEIKETVIANIYHTLKNQFNITRYRIAILNPKTCYGWHKDEEVRIHVPIFTNPGSYLITDDGIASHLPADGACYLFRANNSYHTAINSDYIKNRIHLLINVIS